MKRVLLLLALAATPAGATDVELLVDRLPTGISIYMRMPAGEVEPVLGRNGDELLTDGRVDYAAMRDGTFEAADRLFARVDTEVAGTPVVFEALSLMVHQPDTNIPFSSPFDADMAIAVCNAPTDETVTLADLDLMAGFYAHRVDSMAEIALDLPETGRPAIDVSVIEFVEGAEVRRSEHTLDDGARLVLPPAPEALPKTAIAAIGSIAALLFAVAWTGVRRTG
ncbi:MAG: hypothetical protein AAF913_02185 [Pseudomonadota bacterium]